MCLNVKSRNSNAADEVKILQTEAEGKKIEIQRLQDKCSLHEKENKDLQKKHSKVLEERDNIFQRYLTLYLYIDKSMIYQNNTKVIIKTEILML